MTASQNIQIFNINGENHEYTTRSKDEPRIPLHKTTYLKYSPHYCVKMYQSIPDNIPNLPDDNCKSQLKNFLYEQLYYNWKELLF